MLNFQPMYDNTQVSKEEMVTLCCRTTHFVRLQQMEYKENDGLYAMYGSREGQNAAFMREWLHYFVTEVYKSHFKWIGYNYLAKKGLDLDLWAESIKDGHRPDFLTLFALNALLEMHAAVHIKDNKIWTSMNDPPDDHNELLERFEYHLVYLGQGNFVELVKRQHPLIMVNSTEDITTIEIGCFTFDEEETLNSVIYRGLRWGIDPSDKTKKTGIPFVKDLIKQEPETSINNAESD